MDPVENEIGQEAKLLPMEAIQKPTSEGQPEPAKAKVSVASAEVPQGQPSKNVNLQTQWGAPKCVPPGSANFFIHHT